ncbi:hypothetical protein BU26DRAFT_183750 [Trematosphaeria pertusa]|uniref:Uncharacterized protein n=1 Tax=Trematosphaeria pertusa TaxID=390896 RepID=A0A6A6HSS9_9PLEO|nr:uncharacterized protein BU26DRAFT_183750 [Trematosphaeria pertusa]KAF2241244.1 hypothetical protein BU26DRAFT_183750 [Trematosphaeria pertusa]
MLQTSKQSNPIRTSLYPVPTSTSRYPPTTPRRTCPSTSTPTSTVPSYQAPHLPYNSPTSTLLIHIILRPQRVLPHQRAISSRQEDPGPHRASASSQDKRPASLRALRWRSRWASGRRRGGRSRRGGCGLPTRGRGWVLGRGRRSGGCIWSGGWGWHGWWWGSQGVLGIGVGVGVGKLRGGWACGICREEGGAFVCGRRSERVCVGLGQRSGRWVVGGRW